MGGNLPEDGVVRDVNSRGGAGGIRESDLVEANGRNGCGDLCDSSIECFSGMACERYICVDNGTKLTSG